MFRQIVLEVKMAKKKIVELAVERCGRNFCLFILAIFAINFVALLDLFLRM